MDDSTPFQFDVYSSKEDNHRRYNAIGRLITDYIYGLLQSKCGLIPIPIPVCRAFMNRRVRLV